MSDLRIGGLGSGMDVGGTIAKIMEIETQRVKMAEEDRQIKEDKIKGWIDVKTTLNEFTKAADTLRWMDIWRKMAPTSTNLNVVSATANSTAANATYSIEVLQLARAQTIGSTSGLTTSSGDAVTASTKLVDISGVNVGDQFAIAGQTFTIGADDTIATLRTQINDASANMPEDQRVTATILDNRLVLQRANTGTDGILLSDLTGSSLQSLGILDAFGTPANELMAAQNAVFTVNGAVVERSSNTGLDDVIHGVTLNLSEVGTSTLTIGRDTEAIKEAIRTFVDTYNGAAEAFEFYGQYDSTDPSNPIPGLMQNDSLIREMTTNLRRIATQLMSGTHTADNASYSYNGQTGIMNSLSHVGIWTTGKENRLEIVDESRLDTLLSEEFDKVENLFRGIQGEDGQRTGGIALGLYNASRSYTSELDGWIDYRIENINDQIDRQNADIDRMISRMEIKESMLWKQFNAMDDAIGSMNKQLEWVLNSLDLKK